ncbi:MAG: SIR2 family protein [Candidatus Entotheonellia bacterium]
MTSTIPDGLINAVKEHRCVLFVGSGLSAAAGYPSWSELMDQLVQAAKSLPQARADGLDKFVAAKDFLTLAEFARSTLGVSRYSTILRNLLAKPLSVPRAHEIIARTDYRGVITTNYDKLLETAFTVQRKWAPAIMTPESVSSLGSALYGDSVFILKLHGDIDSPESIVLTEFDYDRMILRNPHVRSFLQAVFLNYTLLFVGYSLQDAELRLVLKELVLIFQGYTPVHDALLPNAGDFEMTHLMNRMNIQWIPYTPTASHEAVIEALDQLQQTAPFGTA